MHIPKSISKRLDNRAKSGNLRSLNNLSDDGIDLCSNDYLGFSTTGILQRKTFEIFDDLSTKYFGSTGSRLISGNSDFLLSLEEEIAKFYNSEAALIFNSGYSANISLLSALPTRHDTIIYDELSHASIYDGVRLSFAKKKYKFKHNDLEELTSKLAYATGDVYIVVESLYSMDGDFAPLLELVNICNKIGAYLIVDEAHATGIYGTKGKGLVDQLNISNMVLATVCTHGSVVIASNKIVKFLINFARSFIYSTALDLMTQASIKAAYEILETAENYRVNLFNITNLWIDLIKNNFLDVCTINNSPIQAFFLYDPEITQRLAKYLQELGFNVKAINSPTVPVGKERIRVCLHSFNTNTEIIDFIDAIRVGLEKFS
jgi:8-amino-7-oxononanoate synthase